MYDLVIRGGTIVDGSGDDRFVGDVAIMDGRIAAIGKVEGTGARELDATGQLVTPGWVDMHTHYDGQVTWDPYLTPSGWHGVTTAVMGNCGVGFAPCRAEDREWLIQTMEGVEDIPGTALTEGIDWDWETFPEYLDALERKPHAIDFAAQVPHSALRAYVMGEKASEQNDANPEEIARMKDLVAEALNAGAVGFSTSRTPLHKTARGVEVAGTRAQTDELFGIAQALRETAKGVFECASEHLRVVDETVWMKQIARETGRPVVFNLSQIDEDPTLYARLLKVLEECEAEGLPVYGQSAGRAIGICMSWQGTAHPFAAYPSWLQMMADGLYTWEQKRERIMSPGFKEQLLSEKPFGVWDFAEMVTKSFDKMFPLRDGNSYEPEANESIAAVAEREGRTPQEVAFDWLMEADGNGMIYFPLFNYSGNGLDASYELHSHERTFMGLSDGGAHCGAICDAGMPTFMLSFWTRDRTRGPTFSVEYIVKRQTSETADFYGLHDRGLLKVGYLADVNVIDYDNLALQRPEVAYDLPAGGRRLLQKAIGYSFTIKSGQIIIEDGQPTNVMAGGLVRGMQPAPVAAAAK